MISQFDYTYDDAGNRTQRVEADATVTTWSYDATQQLTRERRAGASNYDVTYMYDGVGNTTARLAGASAVTYTYNAANELLLNLAGGLDYEYDAAGNMKVVNFIGSPFIEMTWDDENRLIRHVFGPPNGVITTHLYDGDGRRVLYQQGVGGFPVSTTKKFLWDEENILLESNADDEIQVIYTLEPALFGNLISQRRLEASSWYHFDALGNTDRLTDIAQAVLNHYRYDAFGVQLVANENVANPYRYIGQQGYYLDGFTGNQAPYYVRARFYAPGLTRWISRDPLGFAGGDGNFYRYVWNNPVRYIDPSGLQTPSHIGIRYGNYCGPGGGGVPIDDLDQLCREHDECYGRCGGPGGVLGVSCTSPCRRHCDIHLCWGALWIPLSNFPVKNVYRQGVIATFCSRSLAGVVAF